MLRKVLVVGGVNSFCIVRLPKLLFEMLIDSSVQRAGGVKDLAFCYMKIIV